MSVMKFMKEMKSLIDILYYFKNKDTFFIYYKTLLVERLLNDETSTSIERVFLNQLEKFFPFKVKKAYEMIKDIAMNKE